MISNALGLVFSLDGFSILLCLLYICVMNIEYVVLSDQVLPTKDGKIAELKGSIEAIR
jgi:hypothetical protein